MQNNKTKWAWAALILIVIIGLVIFSKQNGQQKVSETVNTEGPNSANAGPKTAGPTGQTIPPAVNTAKTATKNIVQLTSAGFKPFLLEIKRGESVEFINASNAAMIIHSQTENSANAYPGFSQESGPLGKGGKFYFSFTVPGAWPYYNLNTITGAKDQGVIIVK